MKRATYLKSLFHILLCLILCSVTACHSSKNKVRNEAMINDYIQHGHKHTSSELQDKIVKEALSWIGTPYAYAKSDKGKGTDCSGMVLRVYEDIAGIKIPRNSARQAEFCKSLCPDEVEIGDLVFFATGSDPDVISHVGIMIDELNFVHSSTKKGVVISRIDTPYYIRTFRKFGRIKN